MISRADLQLKRLTQRRLEVRENELVVLSEEVVDEKQNDARPSVERLVFPESVTHTLLDVTGMVDRWHIFA